MSLIEWKDSYSVGVSSLDAQHKTLIKLINQLRDIEEQHDDLMPILKRLDWYVRNHFSFEEAMMRSAGYSEIDAHVKEHRDFEDWLETIWSAARAGFEIHDLSLSINEYLRNWLTSHILNVDMGYQDILKDSVNPFGIISNLTDELLVVLKDARGNPSRDTIETALALTRDIKKCTGEERPNRI